MTGQHQLGLFPLQTVLLPGELMPLHVFEERYKLLFGELMDGGEYGALLVEKEGIREIGCSARVVELIERFEDGRMNVLVQGHQRFRLLEIRQPEDMERHYLVGVVEYVDDEDLVVSFELVSQVQRTFSRFLTLMEVSDPRTPAGEGPLSFRLAAAVDFGAPLKQDLLESTSEQHRLETLLAVMESLIPKLELRKRREGAIRGNGKGY